MGAMPHSPRTSKPSRTGSIPTEFDTAMATRPARTAAQVKYLRERERLTIPPAEITAASDLQLLTLYDVQGRAVPETLAQQDARDENLTHIHAELTSRGVQW